MQPDGSAPDVVLLGEPWLSKALSEYVAEAAAQGARVICVDPWPISLLAVAKIIVIKIRRGGTCGLVKKYHRLHPCNLKALAATNVFATDQIVAADHIGTSLGELGAIVLVGAAG